MGIAIINLPFGDGLHHLFMVVLGGWFTIAIPSLEKSWDDGKA